MIPAETFNVLKTSPLFQGAPAHLLLKSLSQTEEIALRQGELLLSPERPNEHVYMILTGRLSVCLTDAQQEPIALLGEGDCVGEMSVIGESKVSAYVSATMDCRLLAINQAELWALLDNSPQVAHNMLRILAGRIRSSDQVIVQNQEQQYGYRPSPMVHELTGLYNQQWMEEKFARLLRRNSANHKTGCLVVLEIDGFAAIAKSYGRLGSDQALRTVAQAMLSTLRPEDQAGHRRDAQFAIFLPNTTSLEDAETAAGRLRLTVNHATVVLPSGDALPPVSITLGVTQSHINDTLDDLFARADAALQLARQAGGNCVKFLE